MMVCKATMISQGACQLLKSHPHVMPSRTNKLSSPSSTLIATLKCPSEFTKGPFRYTGMVCVGGKSELGTDPPSIYYFLQKQLSN